MCDELNSVQSSNKLCQHANILRIDSNEHFVINVTTDSHVAIYVALLFAQFNNKTKKGWKTVAVYFS